MTERLFRRLLPWAVVLATLGVVAAILLGWMTSRPVAGPSTRVWPTEWRAVMCDAYGLSEGTMPLSLPENVAAISASLDDLPDYAPGRAMVARLRDLLALARAAGDAQARGDVATMTEMMGATTPARYAFFDALTALTDETGEHCL